MQSQRYFLSELRTVAEGCRTATVNDRPFEARVKLLNQLLRQIETELKRADKIYCTPPISDPNAPNFRNLRK